MKLARIAMSGFFSLAIVPMAGMALTFGDSGWTMLIGMGVLLLGTGVAIGVHLARSKREFRYAAPEQPSEKISSHLVALSSAAILAVYAAGYFHTRTAASQFLADASGPRSAEVATNSSGGDAAAASDAASAQRENERLSRSRANSTPADPSSEGRYGLGASVAPNAPPNPKEDLVTPMTMGPMGGMEMGGMPMGGSAAPPNPQPNAQPGAHSSAQSDTHTADQPSASNGAPAQAEPAAPAAQAPATPAANVPYKDGTYLGWGTCRHGDIEASVVIQDGKITSADISKCYTRYPCDIIAQLPGQVVTRQSVEVDYVSGATQSVYAFQQAVSAALEMAKGK